MRPGKSSSAWEHEDHWRPLKPVGRRSAQRVGAWMELLELSPDVVLSSPAARARATATKACKVMGKSADQITIEPALYDGDLETTLEIIHQLPFHHRNVLLVAHKSLLKQLLKYFSNRKVKMSPGTLVRLSFDSKWQNLKQGSSTDLRIIDPVALPNRFPFIKDGKYEYRNRPAYYYNQSAVIPYRIHQGRVEVMIVSSSNNKHWLVPKGIVEPGMSPQESARKEAYEEAGVDGQIEEYIGSYQLKKWGAKCSVAVYSMRVTHTLGDHALLEPHRKRRWLPIERACKKLQSRSLRKLLKTSYLGSLEAPGAAVEH